MGRREAGTEQRFGCRLCHFLLGEADPRDAPSVANGQRARTHTHTHSHLQMHTALWGQRLWQTSETMSISMICAHQEGPPG